MGDDAELDAEPARNRTAEFRVPVKVNLTRPDIAVRRPAKPQDEPGDEANEADEAVDGAVDEADEVVDEASEEPAGGTWYVQFTPPPPPDEEREREAPSAAAPPSSETRPWRPASSSGQDEEPAQEDDSPAEESPAEERPEDDSTQTTAPRQDRAAAATPPEPPERTDDAREARSTPAPRHAAPARPDDDPPPAPTPRSSGRHAIRPAAGHPQGAPQPETEQAPAGDEAEAGAGAAPPAPPRRHAAPSDAERPRGAAPRTAPAPPLHRERPGDVHERRGKRARPAPPDGERPQGTPAPTAQQGTPGNVREARAGAAQSAPAWQAAPPETGRPPGAAPRATPAPPQHRERPGDVRETRGNRALPAPPRPSAPPETERPQGAAAPTMWPEAPGDVRGGAPSSAGPTRVERLPDLSAQGGPWEASVPAPAARTSGQWSVPWDGGAPPAPPAPPAQPARPTPPAAPAVAEKRKGRRWLVVVAAMLVLVAGVVAGQLLRPPPDPTVRLTLASSHTFPGQAPALPWPAGGQAVLYVDGLGTMGSSGGAVPTPTASVAKVMTAYVYLREHPLKSGEAGPALTVSPQAAAQIPARKRRGESLLGVTANQRLTQRKALESLLIISANDVAHELARWDSGSDQAFVAKMNAAAKRLGMTATRYTDPSGYHSGTVSTAADQVKLLRAAMENPTFAEIVNNRMYVPDGGRSPRQGGNFILGRNGVVAGKTGYTDAAGGNFVFAAHQNVGGTQTLIVGAVMGQRSPSAADAVNTAEGILVAAEQAMVVAPLARPGQTVAWIEDGLGGRTALTAASPANVVGWPGLTVPVGYDGHPPAEPEHGRKAGVVEAGAARVPVEVGTGRSPSILKRLTRLG